MNKHITHIITCMLVILLGVAGGVGTVHAGPIVVDHFAIQKTNNDYIALVTLENLGGDTNEHTKVHLVDLEGDNEVYLGVKTVENKETFTFALSDYFNEADENELVKGQVYDMLVSTEDDTKTTSFFYGEESESDDSLITIEKVTVDGIKLQNDEQLEIMPGEELDVVIRFTALEDIDSARLTVSIEGHDERVIMEHTDSFQAFEGVTYRKQLSVAIPKDLDAFESYELKISGRNDLRNIKEKEYNLYIGLPKDNIEIKDVIFNPHGLVYPGQTVTSIVTIENKGYDEQDDVKVEVSIDDLNIKHSDYIFNLDQTEKDITRDLEIDIPTDVRAGTYKGTVTATFNSGYKSVSYPFSITITEAREKAVAEKKLLVSMPQSIEFRGSEAEQLTLTVANPNKAEKVLSVAVVGKDVDASVEKSFKIIQAYDETTFTINVQANEYTRKDSSFNVVIKEEDKVLEELKVEVVQANNGIWNVNWANVGVLVLGVLLVFLVISLIGSLSKRHHDGKDDDETNEEEYY